MSKLDLGTHLVNLGNVECAEQELKVSFLAPSGIHRLSPEEDEPFDLKHFTLSCDLKDWILNLNEEEGKGTLSKDGVTIPVLVKNSCLELNY